MHTTEITKIFHQDPVWKFSLWHILFKPWIQQNCKTSKNLVCDAFGFYFLTQSDLKTFYHVANSVVIIQPNKLCDTQILPIEHRVHIRKKKTLHRPRRQNLITQHSSTNKTKSLPGIIVYASAIKYQHHRKKVHNLFWHHRHVLHSVHCVNRNNTKKKKHFNWSIQKLFFLFFTKIAQNPANILSDTQLMFRFGGKKQTVLRTILIAEPFQDQHFWKEHIFANANLQKFHP